MKKHISFVGLLKRIFLFVCIVCGLFLSCNDSTGSKCCVNPYDSTETKGFQQAPIDSIVYNPIDSIVYNIYIENSVGMKGFFNPAIAAQTNSAKTFIKNIYHEIHGVKNQDDTITLNFLNRKIENFDGGIEDYIVNANSKCIAPDTEVDNILKMAIESYQNDTSGVNIIVSDFIYSHKESTALQAEAALKDLVKNLLKNTNNLSIAILKYEAAYSGTYYTSTDIPLQCSHDLPLYVWFFGNTTNIKRITNLSNLGFEKIAILQSHTDILPKVEGSARMTEKGTPGIVVVKEWKPNRRVGRYTLDMSFSTDVIILSDDVLCNTSSYTIPKGYKIDSITSDKNTCNMKISTQKPSPGIISFQIPYDMPSWVEDANFDDSSQIPPIGKTEGIKYLIQGVYDAYKETQENIISINLNLK